MALESWSVHLSRLITDLRKLENVLLPLYTLLTSALHSWPFNPLSLISFHLTWVIDTCNTSKDRCSDKTLKVKFSVCSLVWQVWGELSVFLSWYKHKREVSMRGSEQHLFHRNYQSLKRGEHSDERENNAQNLLIKVSGRLTKMFV